MRNDRLSSVLIKIVLRMKLKKEEQEALLVEVASCFEAPSKAWSEEQKAEASEKRRAQWSENKVDAVFKITSRNYAPKEVVGYEALAKLLGLAPATIRQKVYRGGGKFTGADKDGDIYTVERISKATYKKRGS